MEEAWELAAVSEQTKVFISWSGLQSKSLAEIFDSWLKKVVQTATTFISSGDIEGGSRWVFRLGAELDANHYGIAFITPENKAAPWIQFEAGALSKDVEKARFTPILCGLTNVDLTGNPLLQFQTRDLSEDGIRKVVHSIARQADPAGYDAAKYDEIFDVWWPKLEASIDGIEKVEIEESGDDHEDTLSVLEGSVSALINSVGDVKSTVQSSRDESAIQGARHSQGLSKIISLIEKSDEKEPAILKDMTDFADAFRDRFHVDEIRSLVAFLDDQEELKRLRKICELFGFEQSVKRVDVKLETLKE